MLVSYEEFILPKSYFILFYTLDEVLQGTTSLLTVNIIEVVIPIQCVTDSGRNHQYMSRKNAFSRSQSAHFPSEEKLPGQSMAIKYFHSSSLRSIWQIANSLPPYLFIWYLMYLSLDISYWLTLGLAFLASGFLIRVFIICHDCVHGSFLKSRKLTNILGAITAYFLFLPYKYWGISHIRHHATANDLDHRKDGDISILTVQEYIDASFWHRVRYRVYRNPVMLFMVGPVLFFLFRFRIPFFDKRANQRNSVYLTNVAIAGTLIVMSLLIGFKTYVLIQGPIIIITTMVGVWLFYVQHQYEGASWERRDQWNYTDAALRGSSFYKLPKLFQWFTGNIGFHHIHHLFPRIPNYYLEKCQKEHSKQWPVKPLTLGSSLKAFNYRLWDEEKGGFVGFAQVKKRRHAQVA